MSLDDPLRNLPRIGTDPKPAMKVVGTNLLHIHIGDLCTRIRFSIVGTFAVNVLFGTTDIDRLIRVVSSIERRVVSIDSRAVEILASHSIPPCIITSVGNLTERAATRDSKEPQKGKMDLHGDYTVHVIRAKTIPPQSIAPIRVIPTMSRPVALKPILYSRNRRCCIPMKRAD